MLMEAKPARIEMLRRLLRANRVELSSTDEGIQDLNDWFRANVEPDTEAPGRVLPDWYSVVNDAALFLGEAMIERCPGLRCCRCQMARGFFEADSGDMPPSARIAGSAAMFLQS